MDKVIAYSNRTELRDKITRIIQYISKLMAWYLEEKDKKLHKKFIDLLNMTRESRRIFRFFSTIQEIKRISDKIKDFQWKKNKASVLLDIISRFGYLAYWGFDNLYVLAALRKLPKEIQRKYVYISNAGWFFANSVSIIKNIYDIIIILNNSKLDNINMSEIINLNDKDLILNPDEMRDNQISEILKHIKEIIGRLSDLLISSNVIGLPQRFGIKLNDAVLSIAGLTSSCII